MKSLVEITEKKEQPNEPLKYELADDLLQLIFNKLDLGDIVRVSAVCRTWNTVAISVRDRVANTPPWLFSIPKFCNYCELYDPLRRKTCYLDLPELRGTQFCYSKYGWLLVYNPINYNIFLFCPYTRETITLPELELGRIPKLAFSASPKSPGCLVFVIRNPDPNVIEIRTCHPGATVWTLHSFVNYKGFLSSVWDQIVFCKGCFFSLNCDGRVGFFDTDLHHWSVVDVRPPRGPRLLHLPNWWRCRYMVEHNGDIFSICNHESQPSAYKLDLNRRAWVEMDTFAGATIFSSFFGCVTRVNLLGRMRNSIYFPKVLYFGKQCLSYSMADRRFYPRREENDDWSRQLLLNNIWIEPPKDITPFFK